MDNNNGNFQGNMNVYNQYQQYGYVNSNQYQQPVDMHSYNQGNMNVNNQQINYLNYQNQYNNSQMMNSVIQNDNYKGTSTRRFISVGMIMGLISAVLLLIGLLTPAIDFSHFHPEVDIQYNIIKICKNVRLISPIWTGLPIGIIIGIVLMVILSFVRIPQFRLIPCMVVISMFVVMLVDMQNIIVWADELLNSEAMQEICNQEFIINKAEVFKSFQSGIYLMVAGVVIGVISSFLKPSNKE